MKYYGIFHILIILTFSSNTPISSQIVHSGGNVSGVWSSGTHYIESSVTVPAGDSLTINSGVVVKFNTGYPSITLDVKGTLKATNVFFTSRHDDSHGVVIEDSREFGVSGDWGGIRISDSGSVATMNYCTIKYGSCNVTYSSGASGFFTNNTCSHAATDGLRITAASPIIQSNTIRDNGENGIRVDFNGTSPDISFNTITGNGLSGIKGFDNCSPTIDFNEISNNSAYAVHLVNCILTSYDSNLGEENGTNAFSLSGFVKSDQTWTMSYAVLPLPFSLNSTVTILDTAKLTITAGTVFKSEYATIHVHGTIEAIGTPERKIVFTSFRDDDYLGDTWGLTSSPEPGDWGGIILEGEYGSSLGEGFIEYTIIKYGVNNVTYRDWAKGGYIKNSYSEYASFIGINAVSAYSELIIDSCNVNNNGTDGIRAATALCSITNNSVSKNGGYAIHYDSDTLSSVSGNSGTGNTKNYIGITGQVRNSITLSTSTDLPFHVESNWIIIFEGKTLTLTQGSMQIPYNSAIAYDGNFTINSGTTLEIGSPYGIMNNSSQGNILITGTRSLSEGAAYKYNGTSTQVTGDGLPSTVSSLVINNSTGVTLTNSIIVSDQLVFSNGNLSTGNSTITLGTNASDTGILINSGSKIIGNFKRWIATAATPDILFPVGTITEARTVNISYASAPTTGGTITTTFNSTDPGSGGLPLDDAGNEISNYSSEGYWSITPGDGLSGGVYDLDLTVDGFAGIGDISTLRILTRESGNSWFLQGSHSSGAGTTVSRTGMTSFSEFGIGGTGSNPLPVELISFTAELIDDQVHLKWETQTEIDNYGFELEKSQSLNDPAQSGSWVKLGFIPGHGNSNSPKSYDFVDNNTSRGELKYRLKQIDTDGSYEYYSEIVEINSSFTFVHDSFLPDNFSLDQNFPNPFNPATRINYSIPSFSGLNGKANVKLIVYDILGSEVATLVNTRLAPGNYCTLFDASTISKELTSGLYIYRLEVERLFSKSNKMLFIK